MCQVCDLSLVSVTITANKLDLTSHALMFCSVDSDGTLEEKDPKLENTTTTTSKVQETQHGCRPL